MSAPSGSSTEGTGRISSDAAMANPGNLPISKTPFTVDISTPPGSDKSRSLRERRHLPPMGNAIVPSHVGFNHRGYVPQAAREGGPPTRQLNQMNVHNTFHHNVQMDNPQVNFVEQNLHVHSHDSAMTSLVETAAELRHREVLAHTEAQAEAIHTAKTEELKEALRVREGIESQRALDAIRIKEQELLNMGAQYKENLKHEAHEHVRFREAQMNEKIQAYQRVIDANLRQSLSSKEQEILELKRQAEEDRRVQNDRITQLEHMVQTQMQHNLKLQSMLDSQFAQVRPSPVVETAAMTVTAEAHTSSTIPDFEFVPPTRKAAPAAPPPKVANPPYPKAPIEFSSPDHDAFERDGIEIIYHDPKYKTPIHVKKEPEVARSSNDERLPGGTAATKRSGIPQSEKVNSPAPTHLYSPTELGPEDYFDPGDDDDGDGPGDEGDVNGGDGGNDPPPPDPNDKPTGDRNKKVPRKGKGDSGPPDGGDGGDDNPDDDDDEKFRRRMIKFLGGYVDQRTDDKPKVKEADTIKIPAFPLAETYRNWRIKTREAVVAASTDPDSAFKWVSDSWKEDQTLEALRKVAPFATLDAKLLSALTNIITGDFARKVDTFKETEATAGRIVRGRQVLFMLHDHFSTNIKHGATYALQDLFSVQLRGENLKSFISNWDQVLAGIVQTPDESVLETLFYKQVKNCKAIQHDMNEYHRADEGTEKRNYSFLVSAVRRHLDRERLEANRDRVAKGLSGSGRPSAPAVEGKTGFIPKGYCVAWNKGGCSKDNCTYKHETPKPRDRSRKPSKTRGRSTERSGSPKPKGKGKKICKFWKQGRCDRGAECKFLHGGSVGKPRQATPARSASSENKNKKRNPKNPKRKGSRSSSRSKSPKSPKSPKSKGSGTSSSKPSPAAVCLVASMLASVSQAFCLPQPRVICPSIRFDDSPDVSLVKARGNLRPIGNAVTKGKVTFPWGHQFEVDQLAVNDAALTGTMLAGSVSNCLRGVECKCAYLCDTDFGCNECIPKGIKATPAECREDVKGAINLELDWIADTGSAQDLVNDNELPDDYGYYSNNPIRMITANGESSSSKQGRYLFRSWARPLMRILYEALLLSFQSGWDVLTMVTTSYGEDPKVNLLTWSSQMGIALS